MPVAVPEATSSLAIAFATSDALAAVPEARRAESRKIQRALRGADPTPGVFL